MWDAAQNCVFCGGVDEAITSDYEEFCSFDCVDEMGRARRAHRLLQDSLSGETAYVTVRDRAEQLVLKEDLRSRLRETKAKGVIRARGIEVTLTLGQSTPELDAMLDAEDYWLCYSPSDRAFDHAQGRHEDRYEQATAIQEKRVRQAEMTR